jgi:outer membrane immunogenic protein
MKKLFLAAAAIGALSTTASAATLDDVMAQLKAMQQDNQAIRRDNEQMRKEIAALRREKSATQTPAVVPPAREVPRSVNSAMAAVPYGERYTKALPPPPGPYDWTGFYAGLNAGYSKGSYFTDLGGGMSAAAVYDGFSGGGQLGFNWQYAQLLLGVEADLQFAAAGGAMSQLVTPVGGGGVIFTTLDNRLDAFATVRGRLGYAFDRLLVYGTGGFAAARNTANEQVLVIPGGGISDFAFTPQDSTIHSGYTYGGGIEYAVAERWSIKAEYLHLAFNNHANLFPPTTTSFQFDLGRAGVNYHF